MLNSWEHFAPKKNVGAKLLTTFSSLVLECQRYRITEIKCLNIFRKRWVACWEFWGNQSHEIEPWANAAWQQAKQPTGKVQHSPDRFHRASFSQRRPWMVTGPPPYPIEAPLARLRMKINVNCRPLFDKCKFGKASCHIYIGLSYRMQLQYKNKKGLGNIKWSTLFMSSLSFKGLKFDLGIQFET